MASIALFSLGSSLGASTFGAGTFLAGLTSAAFGTLGSFLDQSFIFPELFGQDSEFRGPRLDDLSVQLASEGSPSITCYGPKNRFSGTVIWSSGLEEVERREQAGGKGGPSQTQITYEYFTDVAVALNFHDISRVTKIFANGKPLWDSSQSLVLDANPYPPSLGRALENFIRITTAQLFDLRIASNSEELHIYHGSLSQPRDITIETEETTSNTPGYRGVSYVVFQNLALADYGNVLPQFSFIVEEEETKTTASVISEILDSAGLDSQFYDVSDVTGSVSGYAIYGQISVLKQLEPVLLAGNVLVQEVDGVLKFFNRVTSPQSVTIPESSLAAHQPGEFVPSPMSINDKSDVQIPSQVTVNYIDDSRELQKGSQSDRKINFEVDNPTVVEIPITMASDDAKSLATRLLWGAASERQEVNISLPPSELILVEGDLLTVTSDNEVYTIRLQSVDRGNNLLLKVKGTVEQVHTLNVSSPSEGSSVAAAAPYTPPNITLHILDIAPLREEDTTRSGFYSGQAATTFTAEFRGASVYGSTDDTTFTSLFSTSIETVMGTTDTTLGIGEVGFWDLENTVNVTLNHGTLSSKTESEVLMGENLAIIGNEVIGFVNATLVSGTTYTLSKLMRGLRNTEEHVSTHTSSDRFVYLSETQGIRFNPGELSAFNQTRYFKAVGLLGSPSIVSSQSATMKAGTLLPFSPGNITGSRDGSNNLTISWLRRSRSPSSIFGPAGAPQYEPIEKYEIDIKDGASIVRTIIVESATSVVYTSGQQTTDGLTPGDPVTLEMYQISATIGRGRKATATI